jgi:subtilisin family serine protease
VPGESVQDEHGHGTHCTGIAAGPLNTHGRQRYGVAPDVDLLIGKVLDNTGTGSDDQIIDGIDWAIENGARIISMSLGSFRNAGTPYNALYETVASNILNNPQGALLVAAAGNDSARPFFTSAVNDPAAAPSIMAVAAVNQQRLVADFSNGALDNIGEVNLSAPGVAIYSAWTGNSFRSISGTSMATPMVAGVAALYLEQDPTLTPNQLWHALETHASVAGAIADFGKGLVQAP